MDLKDISFAGKTVVITGGTQGIGKAIAKQCIDMGGRAILVGRSQAKAEAACAELGADRACYYTMDLGNSDEVVKTFERMASEQERIDVLINNAGIVNTSDFDALSREDWDSVIATDLTAVFLASQIVFRHMAANGGGRIVNVASIAGKVGGGYLGTTAYAAAKAGVISLTKSIAKFGSDKNIYCNSVCPAYTKTPMVADKLLGDKEQKVLAAMSLHRAASPDEVANAVLFLASDAASFIQGENLNCDGGMLMNG